MLDRFSGDEDWLGKGAEFEPDAAADRGSGSVAGERAVQAASQVSARRAIEEYRERQRLKRMLDDIFTEGD